MVVHVHNRHLGYEKSQQTQLNFVLIKHVLVHFGAEQHKSSMCHTYRDCSPRKAYEEESLLLVGEARPQKGSLEEMNIDDSLF